MRKLLMGLIMGLFSFPLFAQSLYIDGGPFQTAMVCDSGTVWSTGGNTGGRLGDGTQTNRLWFVPTLNVSNIQSVSVGREHSVALDGNGRIWAWGQNGYGQLGDGTTTNRLSPVMIALDSVVEVTAGMSQHTTLALREDGTVWAWGRNADGILGTCCAQSLVPVQIPGLDSVVKINCGSHHGVALRADGTLWSWGQGTNGQFGDGTTANSNTPRQANLTDVAGMACGAFFTIAYKTDGSLWGFGTNPGFSLGDLNGTASSSTPVQLLVDSIIDAACRYYHGVALKSDGTVWTFGRGTEGEMGNGTNVSSPTTVQVPNLNDVIDVSSGWYRPYAVKSTGLVYVWGRNHEGQYGDSTTTDSWVPKRMWLPCDIDVTQCPVVASFTPSALQACAGETISFLNNSQNALTYNWKVDGQSFSINPFSASYTFNTPGTYTVSIEATDTSCTNTSSRTITIQAQPTVSMTGLAASYCTGDSQLTLTGTPSGGSFPNAGTVSGHIDNGNGTASFDPGVAGAGTYSLIYTYTDSIGCAGSDTQSVTVNAAPALNLGNDTAICDSQAVTLDAGAGMNSYLWQDSSTNQTLTTSMAGSYWVEVSDANGCTNRDTVMLTAQPAPAVSFTFAANQLSVDFTAVTPSATSWAWTFGDGNSATAQDPSHSYAAGGSYQVCLTATDANGCSATFCDSLNVIGVGIAPALTLEGMSLFPNPNTGNFSIDFPAQLSGEVELELFNALGQQLFHQTHNVSPSHTRVDLHIPGRASGIYFLKVSCAGQQLSRRIVVK